MPATRGLDNQPTRAPVATQSVSARPAAEETPEPETPKTKKGGGWSAARRAIATAALVSPLAFFLAVAGGYVGLRMAARSAVPIPVPDPAIATPEPRTPAPKLAPRFEPAVIEQLAQVYAERTARALFGKGDNVKEVKILKSSVHQADPDRRKIDWLWEGDVSFTIIQTEGSDIPVRMTMLYHLAPDGREFECWRNVNILTGAAMTRRFYMKSPWKDWFQDQVSREWNDAVQRTEIPDVPQLIEDMSYKFRISKEEFDEIVHPAE